MNESTDLKNYMDSVESRRDWIHCPHCGSENVDVENFSLYSDMRPIVDCSNCPAKGYLL